MATPSYLGQGQPSATSSGWLSKLFGIAPAYVGVGQTASRASVAPVATPQSSDAVPAQIAIVIPRQSCDLQT
jgi:hypothetical protein